jgi:hypothetical protein
MNQPDLAMRKYESIKKSHIFGYGMELRRIW